MDQFSRFLFISVLLHLSAGLIWVIQNVIAPDETVTYQKAIRIDMIGLPDKVTQDQLQPVVKPSQPANSEVASEKKNEATPKSPPKKSPSELGPAKAEKAKAQAVNKKGTEGNNRLGNAKISQLSALEKLEESMAVEAAQNQQLKKLMFKGNAIVEGSSLSGLDKIEAEDYVGSVESHVRSFWRLPQWLSNLKKMRAKALVKWDTRGVPVLIQIIESSGNDEFDEVVMQTLQNAVPYPAPPDRFALLMRRQGVVFGFPE